MGTSSPESPSPSPCHILEVGLRVSNDLHPITDFLAQYAPFDSLAGEARLAWARQLEVEYVRRGAVVASAEPRVWLVRKGGLSETGAAGELIAHHGEGTVVGAAWGSAERQGSEAHRLTALEDTLLYTLERRSFDRLLERDAAAAAHFEGGAATTLRPSLAPAVVDGITLRSRVGSLVQRRLVTAPASLPAREAAQRMTEERVSCLLIVGEGEPGVVTDRDLRSRLVAAGRPASDPIGGFASYPVRSVPSEATLLEALMLMLDAGVHHLPVRQQGRFVGVLTLADWMRAQSQNAVYLVGDVGRQTTVEGLSHVSERRAELLLSLLEAGADAESIQAVLTRLGDAIHRRLIVLGTEEVRGRGLEVPEGGWAWLAFGSQARREHALGSDQDSGMVIGPGLAEDHPGLKALAEWVCLALDACGYPRCRGGIMASEPECRRSLVNWQGVYARWIREPSPKAVLRAAIFFDQRVVAGDPALGAALTDYVRQELSTRTFFTAHLARDAIEHRPPLGFFRQLVVERTGEHAETLDIKKRGVMPVVGLARVYALEAGCERPETRARLRCAAERGKLSQGGFEELSAAFEEIALQRLRQQGRSVARGEPPGSHLAPHELTGPERDDLRDAFRVVAQMQQSLELSRQLAYLGG